MVNTKVSLDELIYHLAKFHIFLRLLTSFPELFLFCAIGKEETNFGNPISFPYRAGPTNHQPVYPQPAKAFGPTRQPPPSLCRPHTSGGNFPNLIAHCPLLCSPLRQRRFWPRPTTMTSGQAALASSPCCTTSGPIIGACCLLPLASCLSPVAPPLRCLPSPLPPRCRDKAPADKVVPASTPATCLACMCSTVDPMPAATPSTHACTRYNAHRCRVTRTTAWDKTPPQAAPSERSMPQLATGAILCRPASLPTPTVATSACTQHSPTMRAHVRAARLPYLPPFTRLYKERASCPHPA
jgi:hypothetical protein